MKQFVLCLMMVLGCCGSAFAADAYPNKEIQVVVSYGPGGSNDVATRQLVKIFNKFLPKEAVVINIVGAGGAVGTRAVHDAKPDGYKLLSTNTVFPVLRLMNALSFNYEDMTVIGLFAAADTSLYVRSDSPLKNITDLVAEAKKRPGNVRVGVGFGTLAHLGVLALEQKTGIKLNIVDIGGGEQKPAALMGGHVDAYFEPIPSTVQYLQAGTFRSLGIFSEERNPQFPDIPTMREQGVDLVLMTNYGLFGPKGLPEPVVAVLRDALRKTCDDPEFQEEMRRSHTKLDCRLGTDATARLSKEYAVLKAVADTLRAKAKK